MSTPMYIIDNDVCYQGSTQNKYVVAAGAPDFRECAGVQMRGQPLLVGSCDQKGFTLHTGSTNIDTCHLGPIPFGVYKQVPQAPPAGFDAIYLKATGHHFGAPVAHHAIPVAPKVVVMPVHHPFMQAMPTMDLTHDEVDTQNIHVDDINSAGNVDVGLQNLLGPQIVNGVCQWMCGATLMNLATPLMNMPTICAQGI